MRLRTLRNGVNLSGKRVLLRIDANVPIAKGKAADGPHGKIARAAVDIEWLRQRGAKVIVMTHLGRPGGKRVPAYSVRPVAKRLSGLLVTEVRVAHDIVGPSARRLVRQMKNGDVIMLENVRFDPGEERNSTALADALSQLGDIYMNDAFAVSHRAHASVDAITSELTSYAGPQLATEVEVLERVMRHPKHPFVLVMGGLKMKDKLPVLRSLAPEADRVIVGGALAHAFFAAQEREIGRSAYDQNGVADARKILGEWGGKIWLPTDVVVAKSLRKDASRRTVAVEDIRKTDRVVDVGPETLRRYKEEIQRAKMVVWNGPFGYCEREPFCAGSFEIARAIASRTRSAVTVVGGGDTIPVVEAAGVADRFTLLSTGGGAMLEFLAGEKMPGIKALEV
ncbi:phosphoglycerate kinase [Candidatus Uhrbacteria bacterium RIFOXYB12_FULL_58_10]|uniref:Phosphoglycerate kinase n=1 Tax=Candidatus Uhrbacteria bacterium RIFOXYB2_FULL_57_15 TaxID=1802422 RepID=A0A1F7W7Z4_9BACT|nr:MAG: phosphoglycerate kinase [Candidatus Uhrbacteria bacterium RIFOXYB12_FULL_58_10]OGL98900.1 MAG: phosphoglycerate kinase [Candidatus Uhrbacteria bacterium RIFOXYB2_FULL_57_15]OGM00063.1 MAG: phosphoglycerate kinase [Candidatus Uhrbacteria bacterium RIFOXYC12_FULL_57_11]